MTTHVSRWVGRRSWRWLALVALSVAGCDGTLFLHLTASLGGTTPGSRGTIKLSFVNNTPYFAVFSFGLYDPLDETGTPIVGQFFADAEAGLFSHLAIHKWDRFGRNLLEALQAEERLSAFGVSIRAANLQVDSTTYTGWMSRTLQQVLAQGYVMNLREESRKGKAAKLQAGGWSASAPTGYCNVKASVGSKTNAGIEIDPERAEVVKRIFALFADGLNPGEIAQQLNSEGIRSPRRGANGWMRLTVRNILANPFYAGRLVSPAFGIVGQGDWEPLITEEQWQDAQERLGQRRARTSGRVFPLSGLLWQRGVRLTGAYYEASSSVRTRIYVYYCVQHQGQDQLKHYRAEDIMRQVRARLAQIRVVPEQVPALRSEYERIVKGDANEKRRVELGCRISTLEIEADGFIRMCSKGIISEAEFSAKRREIAAEIAQARRQASLLPHGKVPMERFDAVVGMLACLPETWDQATPEDQRALAQAVFQNIEIGEDGQIVGVQYLSPFEEIAGILGKR